ncbi:MAG: hypothetical protein LBP51_01325 [Deferribacteraceae bacterium]|jgi:hypothetical protein|nr:hypothetical protein [Deferribacteraceae bacterium]
MGCKRYALFSLLLLLLITVGCAPKLQLGSVNPLAVDYLSMEAAKDVKTVSFRCDYDKVARADFRKHGDYCGYAKNSDYVSYFIPPDSQSTNIFRYLLAHNAKLFEQDGLNSPFKYYLFFSNMDIERLKRTDFNDLAPTGFAVSHDDDIVIGFTKKELLARLYITPILAINSFEGGAEDLLSDYTATYQLPPYKFTLKMSVASLGRFLGLPDPDSYKSALTQRQKQELKIYSGLLKGSLDKREMNRYAADRALFLHPYLAPNSLRGFLKTARPLQGEGFLNEYLPAYRLYQIELFIIDNKTGKARLAKLFRLDDILSVIISPDEFAALIYRHRFEKVMVRYTHIALPPKLAESRNVASLGTAFIYSDMARRIHTELYIEKVYDLSELPRICVNEQQYKRRLAARGYNEDDIRIFQSYLKDSQDRCTPNQLEIIEHLPEILLKTVQR